MKHKTIETTEYICNLVKVGGNSCIDCLSTRLNFRFDETREIVELLHKHGYDVLTKNDQEFEEKLDSYNRVLELQSKRTDSPHTQSMNWKNCAYVEIICL